MLNKKLLKIEKENSFSKSKRLIQEYLKDNPQADIISLGIGDVSKPIAKPIIEAMKRGLDDLSSMDSFKGYGLYYGLDKLKDAILKNDYPTFGFSQDEIYIGDGAKSDSTNVLELFDDSIKILVSNPAYPIYQNGAAALGRNVYFGEVDDEFKMVVPNEKYDVIYICSPSNPIGNAYSYDELNKWIAYAKNNDSVIIYDNVYRSFIESDDVPRSIYELKDAKKTCIEIRSFSKDASFTSMRCSYYVLPNELIDGINVIWKERTINRFNGASYVSQIGALASYSKDAQTIIKNNIKDYKDNSKYLKQELTKLGFDTIGGIDAPYLWVKTKNNMTSWEAFDFFLRVLNIVVVPGEIFGSNGLHHFRVSGLGSINDSKRAIKRIKEYYEKNI